MVLMCMVWGKEEEGGFMPYKLLWLLDSPHPHWVETTKDNLKLDFRESGFRQFVSLNSRYIITDAMLMFGLEYSLNREELIEVLNPIRLMVKVKPGSYLSISHHFLGAPFEVEGDDVLKEFLFSARKLLEKGGFSLDVLVVSHNPYLEDLVLENLNRIEGLNYRFYGARP